MVMAKLTLGESSENSISGSLMLLVEKRLKKPSLSLVDSSNKPGLKYPGLPVNIKFVKVHLYAGNILSSRPVL
jgi:hypothetical protein